MIVWIIQVSSNAKLELHFYSHNFYGSRGLKMNAEVSDTINLKLSPYLHTNEPARPLNDSFAIGSVTYVYVNVFSRDRDLDSIHVFNHI